jgi:hypothetical protein
MMRSYEDAIRVFIDTLLYIQRSKPIMVAQTFQNDAVSSAMLVSTTAESAIVSGEQNGRSNDDIVGHLSDIVSDACR